MTLFILLLITTGVSLASLYLSTMPYVYISIALCVVSLYAWRKFQRTTLKTLCINIAGAFLVFALFELYLGLTDTFRLAQTKRITNPTFLVSDRDLGYVHKKNVTVSDALYYGDKQEWQADYIIGSNGLRTSSRFDNRDESGECVVFFGGSYTFGHGVRDDQTLPYQVGLKTVGKYQVYNFGVNGYGPHQMLAAMELKQDEKLLGCTPKYALYLAITSHIDRAAGKVSWDPHGPRYVLENETKLRRAGHFDDISKIFIDYLRLDAVVENLMNQVYKSFIAKRFLFFLYGNRVFTSYNIRLYLAIVHGAKTVFEQRYPGSEFHVIYLDPLKDIIIDGFKDKKIPVHLASDIFQEDLRGSGQKPSPLSLSEHDGHPSSLAHALMAEYVVNNILRE